MDDYITTNLKTWSDEETLENFSKFLGRVNLSTQMLENDEGAVIGHILGAIVGEKVIFAEPVLLDWPLMPVPAPSVGDNLVTIH